MEVGIRSSHIVPIPHLLLVLFVCGPYPGALFDILLLMCLLLFVILGRQVTGPLIFICPIYLSRSLCPSSFILLYLLGRHWVGGGDHSHSCYCILVVVPYILIPHSLHYLFPVCIRCLFHS